jgi:hypothetical protein
MKIVGQKMLLQACVVTTKEHTVRQTGSANFRRLRNTITESDWKLSPCLSVCLSVCTKASEYHLTGLSLHFILGCLLNFVETFVFFGLKSDKNGGHLTCSIVTTGLRN